MAEHDLILAIDISMSMDHKIRNNLRSVKKITATKAVASAFIEKRVGDRIGLILFGAVFAVNSAVHSYLILAYSDRDKVAMSVGFYYMANAGGRLVGTVLSGWAYQTQGLEGCLWWSSAFVLAAALLSFGLPEIKAESKTSEVEGV